MITLLNFDVIVFVFSYFYIAIFYYYLLEACSFLVSYGKGVDQDGRGVGEELGGVEGRETISRIQYMRQEYIFNRRKK